VYGLQTASNGDLIACGAFTTAGGTPANRLARWNGTAWSAYGAGLNDTCDAVAVLSDGDVIVGGYFSQAGGNSARWIARYGRPFGCSQCDSIDFNNDTSVFDPTDIDAFLSVYGEGPCIPETATCNDIDFNNDGGVFDPCDIDSFLLVFSEGPCTTCGV
jgi:hypothetical protein